MPVETAADRAAMFADDGEAALYTPPGNGTQPVPCTIIYHRGRPQPFEVEGGSAGMRAVYAQQAAMILADDVPVVAQGGRLVPGTIVNAAFVAGPDTLQVMSRPELDETGKIWTVDLQKITP